jgi:osmotically-inducible protein OsmY
MAYAVGAVAALAFSMSVVAADEPFGSDAWITTKAKIALITSDDVSAMNVNVDTVEGMVTLHGTVPSEQAKQSATAVAKQVEGVKDVRNLLQVVKDEMREKVEATDEIIAENVEKALENDRSLQSSNISVESVNGGVVLLGGKASSLGDHLEALNVTAKVDGVRRVASQITSENRLYDKGLWKEGAVELETEEEDGGGVAAAIGEAGRKTADAAKEAGSETKEAAKDMASGIGGVARRAGDAAADAADATGNVFKDAWITSATKAKLIADGDVSAMDINVDTRDGIVTLFGTVASEKEKEAAEAEARSVSGVRDVKNEIEIAMEEKRDVY